MLDTNCLYVQFLSRTLSPPAIRNYLSEGKLLHLFSGLEFPFNKDFHLSLRLCGSPLPISFVLRFFLVLRIFIEHSPF